MACCAKRLMWAAGSKIASEGLRHRIAHQHRGRLENSILIGRGFKFSIGLASEGEPAHPAGRSDGNPCQTLRSRFDVPPVFLSAFTSSGSLDRAKLAEPAGYLTKPFEENELGNVVAAALQH